MSLWTKLQRNYIKDIEKNVGVAFEGNPSRKDADSFIKKYGEKNRQIKLKLNKRFPPTGKQSRLIKEIETTLDLSFKGKTVKTASKFIAQHFDEYKFLCGYEQYMRNVIYKKASSIRKDMKRKEN